MLLVFRLEMETVQRAVVDLGDFYTVELLRVGIEVGGIPEIFSAMRGRVLVVVVQACGNNAEGKDNYHRQQDDDGALKDPHGVPLVEGLSTIYYASRGFAAVGVLGA